MVSNASVMFDCQLWKLRQSLKENYKCGNVKIVLKPKSFENTLNSAEKLSLYQDF